MEPTQELADAIYRERVLRARATPGAQKVLDSLRLFDFACRIMADGIRNENPQADEAQVQEILRKRLELARKLEKIG